MTEMTLRRHRRIAGTALAIALAVPACSRGANGIPAAAQDPVPVTVATVTMDDVADRFEAGGVVQAGTTATLTARILAPVREVRATPGDRVRAGQVLIVLDGRDLEARARSARAQAASAEPSGSPRPRRSDRRPRPLSPWRARRTAHRRLHAKRSATAQELDAATGALRAAEARVAGAAAHAEAAAPVSKAHGPPATRPTPPSRSAHRRPVRRRGHGEAGRARQHGGARDAADAPRGHREFRLDVRVDESRIGQVSPRRHCGGLARRCGGWRTAGGQRHGDRGRPRGGAGARTFLVKIAAARRHRAALGDVRPGALPHPAAARPDGPGRRLVRRGQMTSVFVVEQDVARLRLVNVSGTEVLAGLAEGDVVVVAPPPALVDGRRVRWQAADGRPYGAAGRWRRVYPLEADAALHRCLAGARRAGHCGAAARRGAADHRPDGRRVRGDAGRVAGRGRTAGDAADGAAPLGDPRRRVPLFHLIRRPVDGGRALQGRRGRGSGPRPPQSEARRQHRPHSARRRRADRQAALDRRRADPGGDALVRTLRGRSAARAGRAAARRRRRSRPTSPR